MSVDDTLDDLAVRARRETLSDGEERKLREGLASSVEARLLHEAGCAFDREAPVEAGDDERIERMLAAVTRPAPRPATPRSRRTLAGALTAGLLLGAVAGAAMELRRIVSDREVRSRSPAPATPSSAPAKINEMRREQVAPVASAAAPAELSPLAPEPARVEARREASSARVQQPLGTGGSVSPLPPALPAEASYEPSPASDSATAGALFAAANRARVAGDSAQALVLYRRVELEFPRSEEALTSRVSLGLLLLQKGEAAAALEHFRAYQARGSGPTLVEAHWGEAQALRNLGLWAEERAALQRIVERFPDSAYAGAATKRLRELSSR